MILKILEDLPRQDDFIMINKDFLEKNGDRKQYLIAPYKNIDTLIDRFRSKEDNLSTHITYTCDCGCNAAVVDPVSCGWLVVSQLAHDPKGDGAKLASDLHFSSLKCLSTWTQKALTVLPGLQSEVKGLYPRGRHSARNVRGFYV